MQPVPSSRTNRLTGSTRGETTSYFDPALHLFSLYCAFKIAKNSLLANGASPENRKHNIQELLRLLGFMYPSWVMGGSDYWWWWSVIGKGRIIHLFSRGWQPNGSGKSHALPPISPRLRLLILSSIATISPPFLFIYFASFISSFYFPFTPRRNPYAIDYYSFYSCCDEQIDSNHRSLVYTGEQGGGPS